jgi:hypothetical protein
MLLRQNMLGRVPFHIRRDYSRSGGGNIVGCKTRGGEIPECGIDMDIGMRVDTGVRWLGIVAGV